MHKFILLPILLCAFLISSCSKDDDPASSLIGSWVVSEFKAVCPSSSDSFNDKAQGGCIRIDGDELCLSLIFKNDGSGTLMTSVDQDSDVTDFTYTIVGNQVEICGGGECSSFVLRGNELSLEDSEEGCDVEYIFSKK